MPLMQYPLTLTWDELAALPRAAKHFDWDDSMIDPPDMPNLAAHIKMYMADCLPNSEHPTYHQLPNYLAAVGFTPSDTGITIKSRLALLTADALFHLIMFEYDDPSVDYVYPDQPPTWKLFNISGDDSVDYYGTMPSCLTNLLLDTHIAYETGLR